MPTAKKNVDDVPMADEGCPERITPVSLVLRDLPADAQASVVLTPLNLPGADPMRWDEGPNKHGFVGILVEAGPGETLMTSSVSINRHSVRVTTSAAMKMLQIDLYVRSRMAIARGRIELPPGAQISLKSPFDHTTLLGMSSFAFGLREG